MITLKKRSYGNFDLTKNGYSRDERIVGRTAREIRRRTERKLLKAARQERAGCDHVWEGLPDGSSICFECDLRKAA